MPKKKSANEFNKSAFIREHADKTPKEVEALAKEKGQTISAKHVSVVRSIDKARAKKSGGGAAKKSKAAPKAHAPAKKAAHKTQHTASSHTGDFERQIRDVIFHIGFDGLNALVERIHAEIAR